MGPAQSFPFAADSRWNKPSGNGLKIGRNAAVIGSPLVFDSQSLIHLEIFSN